MRDLKKSTDRKYCEFVESLGMHIPDEDCSDYREQDDYKAIKFMLKENSELKERVKELVEALEFCADTTQEFYASYYKELPDGSKVGIIKDIFQIAKILAKY